MRRHWDIFVIAAIVVAGGMLRFSRLELMEFKQDEWELHRLALNEAAGQLQLRGLMSSVGLHNPPMAVQLFSIPALFTKDPIYFAWLPAILGTLAIAGGYILARKWMSKGAGLAAMFLFAVSPWAVLESRKIWAQDLLPFFTVCFFLLALGWLRTGRLRWALGAAAALTILNQIHYSTLALWPVVIFVVWRRASWATAKTAAAALALYIACWTPFIVFLAHDGAAEFKSHQAGGAMISRLSVELPTALVWQPRLMGNGCFSVVLGKSEKDCPTGERAFPWTIRCLAVLLFGGIATAAVRARRDPEMWLIILWIGGPTVALSLFAIYFHYMIVCWPATFLAAGLFVDAAARWIGKAVTGRAGRGVIIACGAAALCLLGAREARFFESFLDYVSANGGTLGDYGVAYRDKLHVAQYLTDLPVEKNYVLIDATVKPPSPSTYMYLHMLLDGEAPAARPKGHPSGADTPVYVVTWKSQKGGARPRLDVFRDAGTASVGPLNVQTFLPGAAQAKP